MEEEIEIKSFGCSVMEYPLDILMASYPNINNSIFYSL